MSFMSFWQSFLRRSRMSLSYLTPNAFMWYSRSAAMASPLLSAGGNNAVKRGNIFYIPFEIRTVAIYIFAAAAIVWCLAVVRNRVLNKKTLQEKKTYADL